MASGPTVWALDVGKCALKAMKVRAGADGKLDLLALDYIEHEKILSQPDADKEALIAAALEKFLSHSDITNTPVIVAVPGQHTLARFSKLPPVDPKKIAEIVRYEAEQQIPFDMDEVIWDFQTFQEEETPDVEVGIFAMKRELIRDYLLHYENVGIEPAIVQSGPLALYNCAYFDDLLGDQTTVLLDIGAENTDLIIASKHGLWTRTIPLGGNNFTEVLVKSFKLSFGKAENLKRTAAASKYARQIFQAMRPIFADLVQELQRSIGFYTSTHRDAELTKVLGLGNAFKLPGLQKYLQQNLGMDVDRPAAFNKLVAAEGVDAALMEEHLLSFGVAYGLALQGLKQAKINTNLLPMEIARGVVWRKKRPFFGAAAACLLLASGVIWARQVMDMGTLTANKGHGAAQVGDVASATRIIESGPQAGPPGAQAEEVLAAARFLRQEFEQMSGQGDEELKKIEEIKSLAGNRGMWFKIFNMIHAAVPAPQEPIARAATGREYRDVIKSITDGSLDRGKRKQVFIEQCNSRFESKLDDPEIEKLFNDLSGQQFIKPIAPTEGTERYGFIVTLNCWTPNKEQMKFISEEFMAKLAKLGRAPEQGFYLNRIALTKLSQLGVAATPGAAGATAAAPPARPGTVRPTPPKPTGLTGRAPTAPGSVTPVIVDPLTDEDRGGDWQFDLIFDLVLADLPKEAMETPAPAEGEAAPPPEGGG